LTLKQGKDYERKRYKGKFKIEAVKQVMDRGNKVG
jgi:hypothetical protein